MCAQNIISCSQKKYHVCTINSQLKWYAYQMNILWWQNKWIVCALDNLTRAPNKNNASTK
jgi:hypothetical protein